MNSTENYPYWMALAHLPQWRTDRINRLLLEILETRNMALSEFFELSPNDWQQEFGLKGKENEELTAAKAELPQYASLAGKLLKYEIELIPLTSESYPSILKDNLQIKYAPPLLYAKGDSTLLHEPAVAIVGSHNASKRSLAFTRNVAQTCVENFEVVLNAFAKGVGRTALEAALNAGGRSIMMLSQGILTFSSGFKQYYEPIIAGDLLVCSAYHPKIRVKKGYNVCLYGLAEKIYVAESNFEGGTWNGVIDGLQKGRTIYVRKPEKEEKNANTLLIEKGATPVDMDGNPLTESPVQVPETKPHKTPVQYNLFDNDA